MSQFKNSRNKINRGIMRRTFLRGLGVSMALPWLESLARPGCLGDDRFRRRRDGHGHGISQTLWRSVHGLWREPK